jgi:hypothetical protein
MKLDERRWAVGVHAPFDMPVGAPDLMGTKVQIDGELFVSQSTGGGAGGGVTGWATTAPTSITDAAARPTSAILAMFFPS